MDFRLRNHAIRVGLFIVCATLMVTGYQLLHEVYAQHFHIVSHRSVGLMFVSFYFFYIACPALLIIAFIPPRWGIIVYVSVIILLFALWFSWHPLRVAGMAACTTYSTLLLIFLKGKCRV